jgi:hypothetical protein
MPNSFQHSAISAQLLNQSLRVRAASSANGRAKIPGLSRFGVKLIADR